VVEIMPTVLCSLCGEEVPIDSAGMGGTIMVAHTGVHIKEMKELGMTTSQYVAYCKEKMNSVR
jgi:hypothetical protein